MIIRHGFSTWNQKNLFTGWVDVPLSEIGIDEARRAGRIIKETNFRPDVIFTSVLKRAVDTADFILDEFSDDPIEIHRSWRLNERHYGALTGLDKKATVAEFGQEQVLLWRRSFDRPPPPLADGTKYDFSNDPLYADVSSALIPKSECLKDVYERVIPYFEETIAPRLMKGDNVLVVAHGNSLRALIMELEKISEDEIANFELPTGTPRLYKFNDDFTAESFGYVEDQASVDLRAQAVKNQISQQNP